MNISAVRSEDGGLYTCRAANSLGVIEHTSRLNIYGKLISFFQNKPIVNVTVVGLIPNGVNDYI